MKILALDIATRTGVAFRGPGDNAPRTWAIDLGKGQTEERRFARCLRMVKHYHATLRPDLIAVEAAIGGKHANAYLIGLVACVRAQAAMCGVPVKIYHAGSVRKHFIGKALTARDFPGMSAAKAKLEIKRAVADQCHAFGWHVDGLDEADAAALLDLARAKEGIQSMPTGGLFEKKIENDEKFEQMWRAGIHPAVMASHYGVTRPAIYRAANRFGLGKRGPLPPETLDLGPMTIEAELAFTNGRYALLMEIADREGWSSRKVIIAYHRARLGKPI